MSATLSGSIFIAMTQQQTQPSTSLHKISPSQCRAVMMTTAFALTPISTNTQHPSTCHGVGGLTLTSHKPKVTPSHQNSGITMNCTDARESRLFEIAESTTRAWGILPLGDLSCNQPRVCRVGTSVASPGCQNPSIPGPALVCE